MDRRIVAMLALIVVLLSTMTAVVIKVGLKENSQPDQASFQSPDVDEDDPLYSQSDVDEDDSLHYQDDDEEEEMEDGFFQVRAGWWVVCDSAK